MKLKSRPNQNIFEQQIAQSVCQNLKSIPHLPLILLIIITTFTCASSSTFSEHPIQKTGGLSPVIAKKVLNAEVGDLQLTSDLRAVKLRWSYERSAANEQPATFAVRYCELTSWNIEIKCRQRDLEVETTTVVGKIANDDELAANAVIKAPLIDTVRQLIGSPDKPSGPIAIYEAYIYDLRALTNYTFQVRVARFAHELPVQVNNVERRPTQSQRSPSMARRLSVDENALFADSLAKRIETKPFNAEATKCLADVSEVIINTGRFFGGRISVEDSTNPRCTLLGNKTSEQSSYLFRIDHELCGSKLVDGKRIGTMILVHENKDILTHNTARFLVLCNFLQKSFTLRASISLPKVNGMLATQQSRSAVITSLPRRPSLNVSSSSSSSSGSGSEFGAENVAARNADESQLQLKVLPSTSEHLLQTSAKKSDANGTASAVAATPAANSRQQLDELDEINTIEKRPLSSPAPTRQSKGIQQASSSSSSRRTSNLLDSHHHARSLTLSSGSGGLGANKLVPQPVQVQSKVLYVERTDPSLIGKLQSDGFGAGNYNNKTIHLPAATQPTPQQQPRTQSSQIDTSALQQVDNRLRPGDATSERETTVQARSGQVASWLTASSQTTTTITTTTAPTTTAARDDELSDLQSPSIIMTNNHRVAGDYPSVSALPVNSSLRSNGSGEHNYSIKYSAAKVNEYSIGQQTNDSRETATSQMKVRSGRMNPIGNESQTMATVEQSSIDTRPQSPQQPFITVEQRMGEVLASADAAETLVDGQSNQQVPTAINQTLAQNITGYLLKWSLKALSNLAKKSLESLTPIESFANETEVDYVPATTAINLSDQTEMSTKANLLTEVTEALPLTTTKKPVLSPPPSLIPKSLESRQTPSVKVNTVQTSAPPIQHTSLKPSASPTTAAPTVQPSGELLKLQEELQDGFLTNRRSDKDEKEKPSAVLSIETTSTPKPHPTRPANYSKSLDFNRNELLRERQRNIERVSKVNASARHRTSDYQDELGGQLKESSNLDSTSSAGWALYGVVLIVALALGVFFTFWLVSFPTSTSRQTTRLERNIVNSAHLHPIAFNDSTVPVLVFNGPGDDDDDMSPVKGQRTVDLSYQRYDYNKFENYNHEQHARKTTNLLTAAAAAAANGLSSQKSPSTSSESTRSTSEDSTILAGDENDCKNNEFLYTEHVLINTDSSFGESYA